MGTWRASDSVRAEPAGAVAAHRLAGRGPEPRPRTELGRGAADDRAVLHHQPDQGPALARAAPTPRTGGYGARVRDERSRRPSQLCSPDPFGRRHARLVAVAAPSRAAGIRAS